MRILVEENGAPIGVRAGGSGDHPGTVLDAAATRRHGLTVILLAIFSLLGFGRLTYAAWIERPLPKNLPEKGARTDVARPLLLIVIDGLREQEGTDPKAMPWLRQFAARGASGISITGEPTLTAACVRAIVSGRAPDMVTGFQNFQAPAVAGNILGYLADRGGVLAHGGDAAIHQTCRPAFEGARVFAVRDQGPTDQGQTDAKAVPFVLNAIDEGCNVVTLHLTRVDHAGHKFGADTPEYYAACTFVDGQLKQVVEKFLGVYAEGTVLIASDHGVSSRGTHGGGEMSARRAPFVLFGPQIARVRRVEIDQCALAPTLSMVLGLPQPPLADAPPQPGLTILPPALAREAIEAYIEARLHIASSASSEEVDIISRKRAALAVGQPGVLDSWMALADNVNQLMNPEEVPAAGFALLLAWLALATVMFVVRSKPLPTNVAWPLNVGLALGSAACLNIFAGFVPSNDFVLGGLVVVACFVAVANVEHKRVQKFWIVGALLAAIPILGGGAKAFQSGFSEPETVELATGRLWLVLAGVVVVLGLYLRPQRVVSRMRQVFRSDMTAWIAILGAVTGFVLTLRPFIDSFIHTMVIFAIASGVAVLLIWRTAGSNIAARYRWGFLFAAALLFAGTRIAEGFIEQPWIDVTPMRDGLWWSAGTALSLATLALIPPGAWSGAARGPLLASVASVLLAFGFRALGGDGVVDTLGRTGGVMFGLSSVGLALLALLWTTGRGSVDGRFLVRVLVSLALARRLCPRDSEFATYATVALGAVCAAQFAIPHTRAGLAKLAVGLLVLRTGIFHAMGLRESLSTFDVGQGFAGLGSAIVPDAATGDGAAISWQIILATFLVFLTMAVPWILIFSAILRAASDRGKACLRHVATDLAVAFCARGAVLVAAIWIFWDNQWWMGLASPIFQYAIADLILVLVMTAVLGAWRKESAARLPEMAAAAKMPA